MKTPRDIVMWVKDMIIQIPETASCHTNKIRELKKDVDFE